jgi:hypothetical protein
MITHEQLFKMDFTDYFFPRANRLRIHPPTGTTTHYATETLNNA